MVDRLTWNSILPEAMTGLSSQPLPMTTEKQAKGCTKPLVSILLSGYSYMMSHHSCFKHQPWHVHLLQSVMRTVRVTAWMMTNRQLSFSEWWRLIVYISAVESAASAWTGRVSITFITCVGWEILDWFWIGTHSYTLTSLIKPKPQGLLHCHWLPDIHHANTSPTYYVY